MIFLRPPSGHVKFIQAHAKREVRKRDVLELDVAKEVLVVWLSYISHTTLAWIRTREEQVAVATSSWPRRRFFVVDRLTPEATGLTHAQLKEG